MTGIARKTSSAAHRNPITYNLCVLSLAAVLHVYDALPSPPPPACVPPEPTKPDKSLTGGRATLYSKKTSETRSGERMLKSTVKLFQQANMK